MKLNFKWIGAGCFTLEVNDQLKLACDPCLGPKGSLYDFKFFKSSRIKDPVYEPSDFKDVDCWLLTHQHEDHIDNKGTKYLMTDVKKIAQRDMSKWLAKEGVKNVDTVAWGEDRKIVKNDITINVQAVPAIHGSNMLSSFFAGKVNGYWLTITSGEECKTVYITGDTVCNKKTEQFLGNRVCDVLVPNMGEVLKDRFGGPLTLNDEMLDHMIDCLEPLAVLPIHFGCFSHYSSKFPNVNIYHKALVQKTEPGKSLELTI